MTVLFPSPTANNGSSYVAGGDSITAPDSSTFVLDPGERQRLWVFWSPTEIAPFERAGRWANAKDRGAVGDRQEREEIRSLLTHAQQLGPSPKGEPIAVPGNQAVALSLRLDSSPIQK